MKKIIFAFILFAMFLNINVNAGEVNLCTYENTIEVLNDGWGACTSKDKYHIYLKVGDDFGTRIETPQSCNFNDCGKCSHTFVHDYKNIDYMLAAKEMIISRDIRNKIKAGECPKYAFFDLGGATDGKATDVQVCFADSVVDCKGTNSYEFTTKRLAGSITVTQDSILTSDFVGAKISEGMPKADKYIIQKFKADANKSWENNTYCQELNKSESNLSNTIKDEYDSKFWEYVDSQSTGLGKGIQDSLKWRFKKNYENRGDSKSVATTIITSLKNDCAELLKTSKLSDEEKQNALSRLNENFNDEVKNINELFKGNQAIIDLGDFSGDSTCEGFLGDPIFEGSPAYYLALVMKIIKYLGVVLCLVFAVIDFLKAITSQDQELLKKAIKTSVQRLIYAIIIFFLPILINFILGLVGAYSTCVY